MTEKEFEQWLADEEAAKVARDERRANVRNSKTVRYIRNLAARAAGCDPRATDEMSKARIASFIKEEEAKKWERVKPMILDKSIPGWKLSGVYSNHSTPAAIVPTPCPEWAAKLGLEAGEKVELCFSCNTDEEKKAYNEWRYTKGRDRFYDYIVKFKREAFAAGKKDKLEINSYTYAKICELTRKKDWLDDIADSLGL